MHSWTLPWLLFLLLLTTNATEAQSTDKSAKCSLNVGAGYHDELSKHLLEGATLVQLNVRLEVQSPQGLEGLLTGAFGPHLWLKPIGKKGESLLRLEESSSYMSLSTLSVGVVKMGVVIKDTPTGCLGSRSSRDALAMIRHGFLTDFKHPDAGDTTTSSGHNDRICNRRVADDDGYARFQYRCCRRLGDGGKILCEDMTLSGWTQVLTAILLVLKIAVLLYSPLLLPEYLYRAKFKACEYIYHVPKDESLTLRVVVTQDPLQYGEENKNKRVRLSDLDHMEYFKAMVSGNRWQQDKVYQLKVKDCRLSVCVRKLLDQCCVPVGLSSLLYNFFIRCRLRKVAPLKTCCDASILGNFYQGQGDRIPYPWSWCLQIFARVCLLLIFATPWIVRVIFYFYFESEALDQQSRAAALKGLKVGFQGNLVSYLGPMHGLFVVIYVTLLVDSVVFGVLTRAVRDRLAKVMVQCLADMRERSRLSVLGWLVKLLVLPFAACGLAAFLIFPLYAGVVLLLTLPVLAFYLVPSLNLTVRLLVHLLLFLCPTPVKSKVSECCHKTGFLKQRLRLHEVAADERFVERRYYYSTCGVVLQLVAIVMALLSFWSITVLLMETVSFFAEMFVYVTIGVILNTGTSLHLVVVGFLLCLYGKFGADRMKNVYLEYHKSIHALLTAMKKPEMDAVAIQEDTVQQNTAFTVTGDLTTLQPVYPKPVLVVKNHIPVWQASGMLLFMDHVDKAYTPEKFFHKVIDLKYDGCPGPLTLTMLRATWDFVKVAAFLLTLCIIVLIVGDIYQISTTNQLLATIAVGLIPFLYRSRTSMASANTTSVQFKTDLHRTINGFEQSWPAFDIIPVSVKEADASSAAAADGDHGRGQRQGQGQTKAATPASQDGDDSSEPIDPRPVDFKHSSARISSDEIRRQDDTNRIIIMDTNYRQLNRKGSETVSDNNSIKRMAPLDLSTGHQTPLLPSADSSRLSLDDDAVDVDVIVDLSTSSSRADSFMLKKRNIETGSLTMLDVYPQRQVEYGQEGDSKHTEELV